MSSRLFSLPHRLLGIHPVQEVGRNVFIQCLSGYDVMRKPRVFENC